jgi:iron complex transport system substrate-binding protein
MSVRVFMLLGLWLSSAWVSAQAATVQDMLGRAVSVPERPLRVVSLAPSLTETVFALGRGDWIAGVTDFCDYPAAARSKPKVGGTATPNLERIVDLRPDLVLATAEANPRETVGQLSRLGIPVFAVKPDGYAGILESVRLVGRVLGAEASAAALIRDIQGGVEAIRGRVTGRARPRVLYLVWADPPIAAGPSTFIHDLLEMAGGDNIVRERAVPYPRLSLEDIVGRAPEVILVASHSQRGDAHATGFTPPLAQRNGWQSIPAVRRGRVVSVPGDTIHRPGPRVVDGLERLARAIHPEAFTDWRK